MRKMNGLNCLSLLLMFVLCLAISMPLVVLKQLTHTRDMHK